MVLGNYTLGLATVFGNCLWHLSLPIAFGNCYWQLSLAIVLGKSARSFVEYEGEHSSVEFDGWMIDFSSQNGLRIGRQSLSKRFQMVALGFFGAWVRKPRVELLTRAAFHN